jgi:hypothetical protein
VALAMFFFGSYNSLVYQISRCKPKISDFSLARRILLGGIQEKIDFLNPQPNCRFGASMLQ